MKPILFFLGTLAVSLIGSSALAEKPHHGRAFEKARAHGEVVDRASRAPAREARPQAARVASPTRQLPSAAAPRVRCSDVGLDCPAARNGARAAGAPARAGHAGRAGHPGELPALPGRLAKALGSDRTALNEAGEDQGMSTRAANRVWSKAARAEGPASAGHPGHLPALPGRLAKALGGERTSINEAGEDQGMSTRAANRVWARAGKGDGESGAPSVAQKDVRAPKH